VAEEVEPVDWCVVVIGRKGFAGSVVAVVVGGERGVPDGSLVSVVFHQAVGEVDVRDRVVVGPGGGVVGVGAVGAVGDWLTRG
jgi:hypothetical protein